MEKIDIVVLWVDDKDLEWRQLRDVYTNTVSSEITERLYRDYGTFQYWFRMIEKNAPWVNQIYLITHGHLPPWLKQDHPKLKIINHRDYIPEMYLPTFNSNVIELNLHRIDSLSENFILFNDDTFVIKPIAPSDYFQGQLPKLSAVYNTIVPFESFSRVIYNNVEVLNRHFKTKAALKKSWWKFFNIAYGKDMLRNICLLPWGLTGYVNYHLPSPLKKSTLTRLWELEYDVLHETSQHHVRDNRTDINHWLLNYWQIETNQFMPAPTWFGQYMTVNEIHALERAFKNNKTAVVCVNDSQDTDEKNFQDLLKLFEEYFPEKSSFEQ
ncbi:capsular biosynthesis protein [Streptococcus sp. sy010]|uniref:capsular biosynthesis protein n=1 Tax=Streptococcus sp. sy010 TaxID=2600148 RepID=UPI0011B4CF40|nr:capsular biosynthesis protein [Streptococcus sp. sy010]TWT14443.1 capsular biosynthesis protein [Streptococcus sp. sy010]